MQGIVMQGIVYVPYNKHQRFSGIVPLFIYFQLSKCWN
jgi:hypothetical protein